MSTYLCFNIPQQGNVNPTLAIVQGLITRGEQVTYYLTDEFRRPIEATGATFRSYISSLDIHRLAQLTGAQNSSERSVVIGEQILKECRLLLPQILDTLAGNQQPDGIIYTQTALWGRMLAQILHVPAILVHPTYAFNDYFQFFSIMHQSVPLTDADEMGAQLSALNAQLHELCAAYQVPAFEFKDLFTHVEPLTLVMLPRAFQYAGETFDARFNFVGPCILPRYNAHDFPLEYLRKQPTLYIALGTSFNELPDFYRTCLQAFASTPWQVVMAIGQHVALTELGTTLPENFIVHPQVPQLDVLARSSIFISQGGMNSTMEALSYGVPLIVIPQTQEQALTARRIVELELGVALEPAQVTATSLQEAVNYIAHQPSIRLHTRQMQRTIAETGGVHAAVDAILQYLHTRQISDI
ncbi:macrolide family glycosyltransferase [Dictyobacter formicarum]|uniref:UDP-glucosyltransferase YjiC n=1 Tax=Dictyobacter formicarum TaxID=2778368 RepID=A0ABQ3VU01_9CHLR|nr:macrolide family glycosyltransferase [Dictyobacter formicarum]GHO89759.1 putative UDP-glucosyltransferase YjiC [Dictyobacter formicarum]